MNILVLGHKGMLGHMLVKYLLSQNIKVKTIDARWPTEEFRTLIKKSKSDFLINCIGAIPQKTNKWEDFKLINIDLPLFLAKNFNGKILHPTTDCEFSGDLGINRFYLKDDIKDATDNYGISKAYASKVLERYNNVKQLRTSIIGPEMHGKRSLMEWFLNEKDKIYGFRNHYWNGITTFEWSKQAFKIINNWNKKNKVIQLGVERISKYDLLRLIDRIYDSRKHIIPKKTDNINKCLKTDFRIKPLESQLKELKDFYE
jgi:dTDP-4-dehydrorhamnose reductase